MFLGPVSFVQGQGQLALLAQLVENWNAESLESSALPPQGPGTVLLKEKLSLSPVFQAAKLRHSSFCLD